jgi:hypothetical protein
MNLVLYTCHSAGMLSPTYCPLFQVAGVLASLRAVEARLDEALDAAVTVSDFEWAVVHRREEAGLRCVSPLPLL